MILKQYFVSSSTNLADKFLAMDCPSIFLFDFDRF